LIAVAFCLGAEAGDVRALVTDLKDGPVKDAPRRRPIDFPNNDGIRHQVYSFSPHKVFELPLYVGTPVKPIVFDRRGAAGALWFQDRAATGEGLAAP
jgi:hypothetical protein